ncbi:MAG: putative Fe-S cluster assembly protein SufT [Candidatus Marinimicrobia bacterium]|nr:putative Fe-S cluster assembly protein SufT [Candidatus Neomarinimicrobiota bacterium]
MENSESIKLIRDCNAELIPSGDKIKLIKGEVVKVTQSLGGNFTLFLNGNLVKIRGKDADAIGLEPEDDVISDTEFHSKQKVDETLIWDKMRSCFDPEIPVNIVELGLVYDLKILPIEPIGHRVEIKMTLTAPGCGMGPSIASDVKYKVSMVPGVTEVGVDIIWEPQWSKDMMTDAAKLQLGML